MSDSFEKLYSLPKELYLEGAPVVIASGSLLRDSAAGKVLVRLSIRSVSDKTLSAVKVKLWPYDSEGRLAGREVFYTYSELAVHRDGELGQKMLILLPHSGTRQFRAEVIAVAFSDGSRWTARGAETVSLPPPQKLEDAVSDDEALKRCRRELGKGSVYLPYRMKDLWSCTCGAVNRMNEPCHLCGRSYMDPRAVNIPAEEADEDENNPPVQQAEPEKAEPGKRRRVITWVIVLLVLIDLLAVAWGMVKVFGNPSASVEFGVAPSAVTDTNITYTRSGGDTPRTV